MIGDMISKIRKEKGITKTQLSSQTDINIGHLTHIEKGERNPSHKALKEICSALNIPYQQLFYTYDKTLTDSHNIDGYIDCPSDYSNASFAYKIPDDSMEPLFKEGKYAFVEINGLVDNKAIGFFKLNDKYMIRRLMYKKDKFVLRADNKDVKDITVNSKDSFQIIGRVYI